MYAFVGQNWCFVQDIGLVYTELLCYDAAVDIVRFPKKIAP